MVDKKIKMREFLRGLFFMKINLKITDNDDSMVEFIVQHAKGTKGPFFLPWEVPVAEGGPRSMSFSY